MWLIWLMLDLRLFWAWGRATGTDILAIRIFTAFCLCWLATARVFARAMSLRW
jgi:hypothetical protein